MSKKNKKNGKKSNIYYKVPEVKEPEVVTEPEEESDVEYLLPIVLHPTDKGKRMLEEIQARKSKKSAKESVAEAEQKPAEPEDVEPKPEFDMSVVKELNKFISNVIDQISGQGKYPKIPDEIRKKINAFILDYTTVDLTNTDENWEAVQKLAKKLINTGKSYYEYEEKEFFNDFAYDGLLARYLAYDEIEPNGIIPKGKKNLKKTAIQYQTLHNNMDKSYAVWLTDPIPEGVKEKDSVEKFLQRCYAAIGLSGETEIELELSPKIDGISINGTIVDDKLVNPQTRGDSSESVQVIGLNGIQVLTGFPRNDKSFGIQYEAFVTEEDRVKASEYIGTDYAGCRQAAAGIINRLSTKEDDNLLQFLSFYPIMTESLEGTYTEVLDFIQDFGVVPDDMPDRKIIKGDMKTLLNKINRRFQKLAELRNTLSFNIDGMVITVVDDDYQKTIGREGRTNKYQIALKFDPATAIGEVKGVWLDSGSKGYRTIQVDLVDPVYLDNVRYDHVPVLSAELFKALELRENSEVKIHRVGDVIPSISVVHAGDGKKIKLPEKCPACGEPLIIKAKKLYCSNPLCKDNIVGRLTSFFDELKMDDYGESFAELVHTKFDVNCFADLFVKLTDRAIKKSGINNKKLMEFREKFEDALQNTVDYKILGAFGIPGVGSAKAKLLLKQYGLEGLTKLANGTRYEVYGFALNLVGSTTADATADFLHSLVFQNDMIAVLPYIKMKTKNFDTSCTVGHSGIVPSKEVELACWSVGWDLTDGKKFDLLLVPRKDHNSTKVEIAKKNNSAIMTEEELIQSIESRKKA